MKETLEQLVLRIRTERGSRAAKLVTKSRHDSRERTFDDIILREPWMILFGATLYFDYDSSMSYRDFCDALDLLTRARHQCDIEREVAERRAAELRKNTEATYRALKDIVMREAL